jgi:uncharacterized membrane protein
MNKPDTNKIKWLLGELDGLKNNGIIDENHFFRIKNYYSSIMASSNPKNVIFIVLTILSAILVSGGMILLFGYNWNLLSQTFKTVLIFLLLIVPQSVLFYLLFFKKEIHTGLKEGLSLILAVAFGASMALIGQVYNIEPDVNRFLLVWSISTLFIVYLFDSLSAVALYITLIITFTTTMQNSGGVGCYFLPMLLALLPHYIFNYRKSTAIQSSIYSEVRSTIYNYFLIAASVIGLGISFEKNIPGLWIIGYANLFVIYYLSGEIFENRGGGLSLFYSPLKVSGIIGISVLAFIFSWSWPWQEIGWDHYRTGGKFIYLASFYDYSFCLLSMLASIALIIIAVRKKLKDVHYVMASFFLVISAFFIVSSVSVKTFIPTWGTNFFILLMCAYGFFLGYRSRSLLATNLSMIFLTVTIVSRFFDETMSLFWRGIIFIVCGILIFFINFKFIKNLKETNGSINEKNNI